MILYITIENIYGYKRIFFFTFKKALVSYNHVMSGVRGVMRDHAKVKLPQINGWVYL